MHSSNGKPWLTALSFLVPAHFTVAYLTMTQAMVPFSAVAGLRPKGSPFDYRMLPAVLWQALLHLAALFHLRWHLPVLNPPFTSNQGWFVALLTYGSLTAAIFSMRALLRTQDSSGRLEWMALLLPLMAYFDLLLVLNRSLYYPYDLTALLLFTLLISAAFRNRVWLFAILLVPAMLNKETAAAAILAFAAFQWKRKPTPRLFAESVALLAVAGSVRLGQRIWISHVCGCSSMSEVHLSYNIKQLLNPLFWLSAVSLFAFTWMALVVLWKDIPSAVRRAVWWVGLPWCLAMMYAGILRELRIFSDLSVLVVLAIATGLQQRCPSWFARTALTLSEPPAMS